MAGAHFEKLIASSGISAHLTQYARSRNIELKSPMSRFLNWSLCLTSVEERLAPRSRVCACLDSGARKQRENARDRKLRQIAEFVAVLACGLFTGAAVYVSLVEHPARMECGVEIAATEFPPSYPRASVMQETLAAFVQITLAKVQRGLRVCTHDPSHERQEQTRETSSPQIASP